MLTLGAGREILPHNMAVTKMVDADDIYTPSSYTHAIHVYLRMRGKVVLLTRGLLPVYQLAESVTG